MTNPDFEYLDLMKNQFRTKMTKKQWIAFFILISLFFIGMGFYSYYSDTGLFPLSPLNKSESILPPECDPSGQTFEDVSSFMQSDNTNTIAYCEGFNCVDSVFRVWLNARWQGIAAIPIAIQYEKSSGHMVIGFPTIDRGDVFFETQNNVQIRPRVDKYYNGKKVRGFYYMDVIWFPLDNSPEYDYSKTLK